MFNPVPLPVPPEVKSILSPLRPVRAFLRAPVVVSEASGDCMGATGSSLTVGTLGRLAALGAKHIMGLEDSMG